MKLRLMHAMEAYFGGDVKRISHARQVTEYAEELLKREGGNYPVVLAAAVLHDIGIPQAERKYGSPAGKYQEIEGPPIARAILTRLGFPPDRIEEVCQVIAHHHSPGEIDTINFRILYDADWLVNLADEFGTGDRARLERAIDRLFLTPGGRALARGRYLAGE